MGVVAEGLKNEYSSPTMALTYFQTLVSIGVLTLKLYPCILMTLQQLISFLYC